MKDLLDGIRKGESSALAQAITLMESSKPQDWPRIKELLSLLPKAPRSFRLGFSGPPGVGKSTFIEKLGLQLVARDKKVAVLAVDPSSQKTGGSILGDKTRMEKLSQSPRAFIRPSPNRGHLGGVTSSLPGIIVLCEAAGFHWILVESVGVGQSEVELARMVDIFTLLVPPGAGDELQGIKKGILEFVDLVLINKMDRDLALCNVSQRQYLASLRILKSKDVPVEICSALTGEGINRILKYYFDRFEKEKTFDKRQSFFIHWFESLIHSEFRKRLRQDSRWMKLVDQQKKQVGENKKSPVEAVDQLFKDLGLPSEFHAERF